eukprot:CAMPEP_0180668806 /NCGR_PEP_ID=MMETSP1037_2-20121125/63132_1 /TAXON_ID=632150 /ORGANISM="Azadinium spinosum, Strain 3D9" /LENGTH=53 /DNA_ID=CAMNT_0022697581 /DNA_START=10 /DNA_END=171 /DNA_ORIENTATION=+
MTTTDKALRGPCAPSPAPASRKKCSTSTWPFSEAASTGLHPMCVMILMSAPAV